MLGRKKDEAETEEDIALSGRTGPSGVSFAVEGGIDSSDLGQAGWGVIFAPGVDQSIKEAIRPLLDHRKRQAGEYFKVFDGSDGYLDGDTASEWLKRRRVKMDVVNPDDGVPFYLLLVGPPESMPFEFQYGLDIYWAVGRLWFDTADEFRRYAGSIIEYENPTTPVGTARRGMMFATEHDFDEATQLFTDQVAKPLAQGPTGEPGPVWKRAKFAINSYLGEKATKETLTSILQGKNQGTPALLMTGSHGLECPITDPLQAGRQGAIVCQDWTGYGAIKAEHWFASSDLPDDAKLHGLIHFFFACYGAGCTELDNYDRLNNKPRKIAEKPFLAKLPQNMLSHRNGGCLAVLAHVERAWAYSFQEQRGRGQIQGFRDVIGRLLRGERIGQATDMFNMRWAAMSTELSEMHADLLHGVDVPMRRLGNLWIARDDARNFIVLGDPAVRLRVEDMPEV
jgi:hypothetical protein